MSLGVVEISILCCIFGIFLLALVGVGVYLLTRKKKE
jgi:hypothetical protein